MIIGGLSQCPVHAIINTDTYLVGIILFVGFKGRIEPFPDKSNLNWGDNLKKT